jgi:hypothetical protein
MTEEDKYALKEFLRGVGVFLVGLENQQWTLLARYD